jgi:hypothetical protein
MAVVPYVLAYLLSGLFFVGKDFLQPAYNRPGYIRDRQLGMMTILVLLWFPWTVRMFVGYWQNRGWWGIKKYLVSEAGAVYAVFVVLVVGLGYFFGGS